MSEPPTMQMDLNSILSEYDTVVVLLTRRIAMLAGESGILKERLSDMQKQINALEKAAIEAVRPENG